MSTTYIKRLKQNNVEFVPITLSEAVVVNTTNIPGLADLSITTLDKVLSRTTSRIGSLQSTVDDINTALLNKQDKLTAGVGIEITEDGTISVTNTIELYKIVTTLPTASVDCLNTIYLVPTDGVAGNIFIEYICVFETSQNKYIWEEIGKVQTNVDLSGYVTTETFNSTIDTINGQLANTITAVNVTTSNGQSNIVVNYTIPTTLYDSVIGTGDGDEIITG